MKGSAMVFKKKSSQFHKAKKKVPAAYTKALFKKSPSTIAQDLKKAISRRKDTIGSKFNAAISLLNQYIAYSAKKLEEKEHNHIEGIRDELKKIFQKEDEKNK